MPSSKTNQWQSSILDDQFQCSTIVQKGHAIVLQNPFHHLPYQMKTKDCHRKENHRRHHFPDSAPHRKCYCDQNVIEKTVIAENSEASHHIVDENLKND